MYPRRHELVRKRQDHRLVFYEVELVRLLAERSRRARRAREILEKIWGVSGHASNRAVDNYMVKLRKKSKRRRKPAPHRDHIRHGYKLVA